MTVPNEGWLVPDRFGQASPESTRRVARLPRPAQVTWAVRLTYLGVAAAALDYVVSLVVVQEAQRTWNNLDPVGDPPPTHFPVGPAVVLGLGMWLVPAIGAVVAAFLCGRAADSARGTLLSFMIVFAVANLGEAAVVGVFAGAMSSWAGASVLLALTKIGLAVVIGGLLSGPAAREFSARGARLTADRPKE
jgi:hypothetical protein